MGRVIVLDSSALLAYFFEEKGADRVAAEFDKAILSAAQYAETIIKLCKRNVPWKKACFILDDLKLPVADVNQSIAAEGARLHGLSRPQGLSLADAICLATAKERRASVLTADRAWSQIADVSDVEIIQLRPDP
jgi:PIN domain nuclease of toxin-antitoxin system